MDKQQRIYHILTYANTALLIGCVLFLTFGSSGSKQDSSALPQTRDNFGQQSGPGPGPERGNSPTAQGGGNSSSEPSKRSPETIGEMFADIIAPVKRAAVDHQVDPNVLLPTQKELDAAIASNSFESAESQVVLSKLKKGYAQYNMPFPNLGAPPNSEAPPQSAPPPTTTDPKGVEAWLEPTIKRLRDEAMIQKLSVQDILPTEEQREAAIKSGAFDSPEFKAIQKILEDGYAQLNIPFPDPSQKGQAPDGGNPPPSASGSTTTQSSAEQQIIKAYFQGQVQRIKLEGKKQDKDIDSCLPDASSIQQAAESGSISSQTSKELLSKIESCYSILELPFYPPVR